MTVRTGRSALSVYEKGYRPQVCKSSTLYALTTARHEQPVDTRHAYVHGEPVGSRHALGCKQSASWHAVRRAHRVVSWRSIDRYRPASVQELDAVRAHDGHTRAAARHTTRLRAWRARGLSPCARLQAERLVARREASALSVYGKGYRPARVCKSSTLYALTTARHKQLRDTVTVRTRRSALSVYSKGAQGCGRR